MEQLTTEQAITFYNSDKWKGMSDRQIAELQIMQDKLCVPFEVFHKSIEKTLERPVYTHEFGLNREGLKQELFGGKNPPELKDIINILPKD